MGKSALNSILIYGAANRFTFVQNHSRTLLYNLWVITYFLKITSTAWVQIFATQWGPRLNRGSVLPNFITEGSYSLLARFFSCGTTEEKFYRVQSSRTEWTWKQRKLGKGENSMIMWLFKSFFVPIGCNTTCKYKRKQRTIIVVVFPPFATFQPLFLEHSYKTDLHKWAHVSRPIAPAIIYSLRNHPSHSCHPESAHKFATLQ